MDGGPAQSGTPLMDVSCSQVLNGSFSLELVSEKYWKVNKPMELYFAPTKEHK